MSRAAGRRPAGPKAGWDALTETERRVAALLAEGLSDPDIAACMFTSRRTVQFHVSNILAKLDLSSRADSLRWPPAVADSAPPVGR